MRTLAIFLSFLSLLGLFAAHALAEDDSIKPGQSSQSIEGLQVELVVPSKPTTGMSLVIILHGAGGSATGMAGSLRAWADDGYVVVAPKSTGQVWAPADLEAVLRIAKHVKGKLDIDPRKVHVVGFSNGGWNLAPLAFDEALRPCSAAWVAAGYDGARVPKWAKESLGVIALAGTEDANVKYARQTVPALRDKVRTVEVRTQRGLGHKWPGELMPYLQWWMGAMEGRFVPGVDQNFDWQDDVAKAVEALKDKKRGGVIVYAWSASDADVPSAKKLTNELLMDSLVRHYGNQLQAVKLDFGAHTEALAAMGVKATPALVVLDRKGKPKKVLSGKTLKARKIASAFRGVAPNRAKPE